MNKAPFVTFVSLFVSVAINSFLSPISSLFSLNFCVLDQMPLTFPSSTSLQELPYDIQANLTEELPQPREIPKKLSEYTREEIDAFPRLWTPYVEA